MKQTMNPGMEEDDDVSMDMTAFKEAVTFARKALYEDGAAKGIAQSLKVAPSPVEGLADTAYRICEIVDERTGGNVPDEHIMILGAEILEEVTDIGEAAGIQYKPTEVAEAFKQMILRFLGEQGLNTTELEAAMSQVDPAVFEQAAEGV
jgi:hypothetical protein